MIVHDYHAPARKLGRSQHSHAGYVGKSDAMTSEPCNQYLVKHGRAALPKHPARAPSMPPFSALGLLLSRRQGTGRARPEPPPAPQSRGASRVPRGATSAGAWGAPGAPTRAAIPRSVPGPPGRDERGGLGGAPSPTRAQSRGASRVPGARRARGVWGAPGAPQPNYRNTCQTPTDAGAAARRPLRSSACTRSTSR